MPAVSARQYRAMRAASHGESRLGIPKSVGKEFVDAGPPPSIEDEVKGKRLGRLKRTFNHAKKR